MTPTVLISILGLIAATNAAAVSRSDRMKLRSDRMKSAFNRPPQFSHRRDNFVRQNVDIVEPASSVRQNDVMPPQARGQSAGFKKNNKMVHQGLGVPVRIPEMTSGVKAEKLKPISNPIGQAAKPSRNSAAIGQNAMASKPVSPVVANDRMVNRMFQNAAPINRKSAPATVNRKPGCDFNIPSFLLPDMTVSQREFEQMYLLPALRAHLTAKDCRSRALTVYIDWLLYLRLRNFNV